MSVPGTSEYAIVYFENPPDPELGSDMLKGIEAENVVPGNPEKERP